jgi:hypothetical protein
MQQAPQFSAATLPHSSIGLQMGVDGVADSEVGSRVAKL